jgi:Fe2+ transport system protein FeoA
MKLSCMTAKTVPQKPCPSAETRVTCLDRAPRDEDVEVLDIPDGRRAARSLEQVGIRVHQKLRVLSAAPLGGPVLVEVAGAKVALGRGLARRIKVCATGGA